MLTLKGGIVIVIILIFANMVFVNAEQYQDIRWNYNGQWSSSGFSDFSGWKTFVNFFINVMLNVRVIEIDGKLALSSSDQLGNQKIAKDLIDFNNNTCKLNFRMNVTLPLGSVERIKYAMNLNGNSNICEIIDYKKYINMTLRDILIDVGSKNITIKFLGNGGNITIIPETNYSINNPQFNMTYVHINDGDYPLIPNLTSNNGSTSLTNRGLFELDLNNNGNIVNVSVKNQNSVPGEVDSNPNTVIKNNSLNKTSAKEFKIIGISPENTNISMFVGEKRTFSIENTDYEIIKWYLDGNLVENMKNKYEFKGLKEGKYPIKVEIINNFYDCSIEKSKFPNKTIPEECASNKGIVYNKNSEIKSNLWSINVFSNENKLPRGLILFILLGLLALLIMIVLGFIIYRHSQTN